MRALGLTPILLTGDNARAAGRLGEEVGIGDVRAGLLPEDKVTAVRDLVESKDDFKQGATAFTKRA